MQMSIMTNKSHVQKIGENMSISSMSIKDKAKGMSIYHPILTFPTVEGDWRQCWSPAGKATQGKALVSSIAVWSKFPMPK